MTGVFYVLLQQQGGCNEYRMCVCANDADFYQCCYSCSSFLLSIPLKNLETPKQTKPQSIFPKEASAAYPEELPLADFPWLVQVRMLKSSKGEIQDVIIRYGTTKEKFINAEHLIMSQQPSVVHIHQLKQVCTEKGKRCNMCCIQFLLLFFLHFWDALLNMGTIQCT